MCTGLGRPVRNSANASCTAATASAAEPTRRDHSAIAPTIAEASFVSWRVPTSANSAPRATPGESTISGRDSQNAVPTALIAFCSPGPDVVITTPGSPVCCAQPSAP
jgi:hypothetical protein